MCHHEDYKIDWPSKMQVGGYIGIDPAGGPDKNVASVWRDGKIVASFEGENAFGRALEFAGIKNED